MPIEKITAFRVNGVIYDDQSAAERAEVMAKLTQLCLDTMSAATGDRLAMMVAVILGRYAVNFAAILHEIAAVQNNAEPLSALDRVLSYPITEFRMSVRVTSRLGSDNIVYIGDLVQKSREELLRIPNFGKKGLREITDTLSILSADQGIKLSLGMDVAKWKRPDGNRTAT